MKESELAGMMEKGGLCASPAQLAEAMEKIRKFTVECYGREGSPMPQDIQYNFPSLFNDGILPIIKRFLDLEGEESYTMLFCWVLGTYCWEIFDAFPYLYFMGIKQSGKSRSLMILQKLANNAFIAANASLSATFRLAGEKKATLLFDELENINNEEKAELRMLFHAGYRSGEKVFRVEKGGSKEGYVMKEWDVYCPKAFASIMRPDDVLNDRCISIQMRRTTEQKIANTLIPKDSVMLPCGKEITWEMLRKTANNLINGKKAEIKDAYETLSDGEIVARNWEMWRPLLAICKVCLGDETYNKLRSFALLKIREKSEEDQFTLESSLLPLINSIIDQYDSKIPSGKLLSSLKELGEWDWISAKRMAVCMKNMGFKSIKSHGKVYWIVSHDEIEKISKRLGIPLE